MFGAKTKKSGRITSTSSAPEWLVTYADAMTLLLCFFVILVSMSEVKKDQRFQQVMESLRRAFGGYHGNVGDVPIREVSPNALIARLLELQPPIVNKEKGETDEEGVDGRHLRVTSVRDGLEVVVGGRITFDRFSATLKPQARDLITRIAERVRGYNTRMQIRGHATREPLPPDSTYADARDLSYARAKAVALELEQNGVRRNRMSLVAVGDTEPLVRQAYTEERRALNRRVELIVTERLVDDYAGSTLTEDLPEGR